MDTQQLTQLLDIAEAPPLQDSIMHAIDAIHQQYPNPCPWQKWAVELVWKTWSCNMLIWPLKQSSNSCNSAVLQVIQRSRTSNFKVVWALQEWSRCLLSAIGLCTLQFTQLRKLVTVEWLLAYPSYQQWQTKQVQSEIVLRSKPRYFDCAAYSADLPKYSDCAAYGVHLPEFTSVNITAWQIM